MKRRIISLLFVLALAMSALACLAEAAPVPDLPRSQAALSMMAYLEADPELMALMEKTIAKAHEINPDPNTNPVDNVDELYDFIDWAVTCMPWNVLTDVEYPTLYNHIDQSIDYIWFLLDQPLEELEGLGYYYPTKKNAMVRNFYGEMGFVKVSEDDEGSTVWDLDISGLYERKNMVITIEEA